MNKTITRLFSGIICITAFALCAGSACKKAETNCFNIQLQRDYRNVSCPTTCPGATGCDGKSYCNACVAAKAGIYAQ
ncbi:MAG: hypothetical protein BGO69_15330 [Bacteroidetes bacterium 46-16]|nr:MAG: hypothetical protein BGO69_15330 [Bacteroidetes bacterium 46-16]